MNDATPPSIPPRTAAGTPRRTVSSRSVPVEPASSRPVPGTRLTPAEVPPKTERPAVAPPADLPVPARPVARTAAPTPTQVPAPPARTSPASSAPGVGRTPPARVADLDEPTPLPAAVATTTDWLKRTTTATVGPVHPSTVPPATEEADPMSNARTFAATPVAAEPPQVAISALPTPVATAGGQRRVRLTISRVDPWSVAKLSFLLSLALAIIGVVAAAVVWLTLDGLHVFTSLNDLITQIAGNESTIQVLTYFSFSKVISASVLLGILDLVLITALSTIGAFLYNIVAALVGGLHVTMTDD